MYVLNGRRLTDEQLERLTEECLDHVKWVDGKDCFYNCAEGCISCHPEKYITGTLVGSTPTTVLIDEPKKQEKKMDYNMNYNALCCTSAPQPAAQKLEKSYLVERLNDIRSGKIDDLRREYNLEDDKQPETAEEAIERIKAGKFVLAEKNLWNNTLYGRLQWRNPKAVKDVDGFKAAQKVLEAEFEDTMDDVVVLDEVDGLAALNAFKAFTVN